MSDRAGNPVAEREQKWLGAIPMGWSGGRLLEVADAWTSNVDKHTVDGQVPVRLCNYVDVYRNDSIVASLDFMAASATRDQIRRFQIRRGDTLITKDSETADDIGVPAFVEYEADDLICGYHLAIVRPNDRKVLPRYLYWALNSNPIARQWGVLAAGVTRVGIRSTDINKITIPLPPLEVQRAIADFLERETAQIDALVAKQEEFIRLLRERRAAGIDRRIGADGSPLVRLRHLVLRIDQGVSPQAEAESVTGDEWGVLKTGCVNRGIFRQSENKRLPAGFPVSAAMAVRRGDLLVSRANGTPAYVGSTALVDQLDHNLILSDKLFRLVPRHGVDAKFLTWTMNSTAYRRQVEASISGAAGLANNLPLSDLRSFRLPLPPQSEQRRIASYLDDECARIDALIGKAEELIRLARERRSALVTAAVTGQIDVRTARKAG